MLELNLLEKIQLAQDPNTPPETLAILATDEDPYVRSWVAENPNTPQEILKLLATDKESYVRCCVAKNPNTISMINSNREKDFKDYVISRDLLGESIEWISKNLSPGDVFSDDELEDWARSNYDSEEALEVSDIIRLAKDNCDNPEEIFDKDRLETWALDNGWVHFG